MLKSNMQYQLWSSLFPIDGVGQLSKSFDAIRFYHLMGLVWFYEKNQIVLFCFPSVYQIMQYIYIYIYMAFFWHTPLFFLACGFLVLIYSEMVVIKDVILSPHNPYHLTLQQYLMICISTILSWPQLQF